jgi:hypothetical protein
MPRKSLKNRKLFPWITAAVKHWRWVEDQLHPIPEVTEPSVPIIKSKERGTQA